MMHTTDTKARRTRGIVIHVAAALGLLAVPLTVGPLTGPAAQAAELTQASTAADATGTSLSARWGCWPRPVDDGMVGPAVCWPPPCPITWRGPTERILERIPERLPCPLPWPEPIPHLPRSS